MCPQPISTLRESSYSFYMQNIKANALLQCHGTRYRMRRKAAQYPMHLFNPIHLHDSCTCQVSLLFGENLDYT